MKRQPIVAIDGPSGAGKSTISKLLARRLGFAHIDTGAMYRCVALAALRRGIDAEDEVSLAELSLALRIEFRPVGDEQQVLLDGEDVSGAIRTPEVSLLTSRVSSVSEVRENLVELQRRMGEVGGVVLEGRDIGTVVFPQAQAKFFLTASARERGRRRYLELKGKGLDVDLETTIAEVEARDAADSTRQHSPLAQAPDAVLIDSTGLSIDQVVARMEAVVVARRKMQE
ncbi:cytidylate kinase [Geoalkalibacter ferrihydriticus]|uniref:Cytidylate kinase n=2 Tax=Geoalkalibacter ferrihydriticus TaxID=392333 RepID=A0A0C2HV28_9BACT|nr:(d)CMP kinase [Geoalkalibacter ferrihydriticus]KIH76622.1 cytidylate kinase [Geoalkalibacter ferrihydriticus DSM 17813]SDM03929.1 cytidylate kinase [Geoalkalibacter ferrihydriticus]